MPGMHVDSIRGSLLKDVHAAFARMQVDAVGLAIN